MAFPANRHFANRELHVPWISESCALLHEVRLFSGGHAGFMALPLSKESTMKQHLIFTASLALSLSFPSAAQARGIEGLWRFDIINSAGTTLGAMTIQTRETVQRQASEQHRWALAKGQMTDPTRTPAQAQAPGQPDLTGYTGFAMTDQGGHALPIESIEVRDGTMIMVVNSPRGLVIFRGKVGSDETQFDGALTYHNGQVYRMRGVKQSQPL
jgi:hypothetical protein